MMLGVWMALLVPRPLLAAAQRKGTSAAQSRDNSNSSSGSNNSSTGNSKEHGEINLRRLKGIDLDGRLHRIGGWKGKKIVGFVFLNTTCPVSNTYLPRLNELADVFSGDDAEFYGVYSSSLISRDEARAHRKKYKIRFPLLFDASGALRNALRPTHAPQAIVLNKQGEIVYSGLIDDLYAAIGRKRTEVRHHYLADALSSARRGQQPDTQKTKPIGCLLEDADKPITAGDVTYCRDIAPIIQAQCAECHRPGESGPFNLLTYEDVSRKAKQAAAVTQSGFMPPWKPVADFGSFRGERRLTEREIRLIQTWVNNGKPKGDPANLPPKPEFKTGWKLGRPDLILKMKQPYSLTAHGPDVYQHFVIPTNLRRPRLVSAIEFHPGNPRVAHHASIFFDTSGTARRLDNETPEYGYHGFGGPGFLPAGSLGNWLPGTLPQRLPQGTGRYMPPRADLVLQMHYQCSGKPATDQSEIGIYFAPRRARQIVDEFQVLNTNLNIPAGAKRFRHTASFTLPADLIILDAAPHMHLLGREMKVTATLPDGTVEPLIWIKDWDFNWQGQYVYTKPLQLPKGTRIKVVAWLDNSTENPLNPNSPPKPVHWGEQTDDEMPLCQFRYTARNLVNYRAMQLEYVRYIRRQYAPDYVPTLDGGSPRRR